jgi:hypothetical protein
MVDGTAGDFARRLAGDLRRSPSARVELWDSQVAVVAELLSHLGRYMNADAAPLVRLAEELGRELAVRLGFSDPSALVGRVGRSVAEVPSGVVARISGARSPADIGVEDIADIVRRRAGGELVADIGAPHGLTPLGVLDLLREVRNGQRAVPAEVVEMAERAASMRRDFHGVA